MSVRQARPFQEQSRGLAEPHCVRWWIAGQRGYCLYLRMYQGYHLVGNIKRRVFSAGRAKHYKALCDSFLWINIVLGITNTSLPQPRSLETSGAQNFLFQASKPHSGQASSSGQKSVRS